MHRHFTSLRFAAGLAGALAVAAVHAQTAQSAQAAPPTPSKLVSGPSAMSGKSVEELHKAMQLLSADKKAPDYTTEKLNPVGGSLFLPRGWLLYEQHNERSYIWTATVAPPNIESRGEARMRLMLQPQMLKTEKRKASLHAAAQVAEIVKAHPDLKACEPTRAGPFIKVCYDYVQALDPEPAPKYHVRASLYYSDTLDMFAMTMFSAPVDKWEKYTDTMAKLDQLEFFDLKKYGPQDKPTDKAAAKDGKDKAPAKK